MTEKDKVCASNIFKISRALNRISQNYFHEQINKLEFFKLFTEQLKKLSIVFDDYIKA